MEERIELSEDESEKVVWLACAHFQLMRDVMGCKSMRRIDEAMNSLSCDECEDFKMKLCEGDGLKGLQCMVCMYWKIGLAFECGHIGD